MFTNNIYTLLKVSLFVIVPKCSQNVQQKQNGESYKWTTAISVRANLTYEEMLHRSIQTQKVNNACFYLHKSQKQEK